MYINKIYLDMNGAGIRTFVLGILDYSDNYSSPVYSHTSRAPRIHEHLYDIH